MPSQKFFSLFSSNENRIKFLLSAVDESKKLANAKKRWGFVVQYMSEHGVTETVEGASAYYRSLKCRYYKAKCAAKKSGEGAITFAHFKLCDEHFDKAENHQLNPVPGCST